MKHTLLILAVCAATSLTGAESTSAPVSSAAASEQPAPTACPSKARQFSILWGLIEFKSAPTPMDSKGHCQGKPKCEAGKGSCGSILGGAIQWD
jgi:hypothetical protein